MPLFPRIDSPCPARLAALPGAGRDFCTLCQRQVHNLSAMNLDERRAFLAACSGPVCVAYAVPRRRAAAAATGLGLAAALSLAPALAAEAPAGMSPVTPTQLLAPEPRADCDTDKDDLESIVITGGAVLDPQAAQLQLDMLDGGDSTLPDLPEVDADAFLSPTVEFTATPPQR
jgi:hypothetical protein